MSDWIDISGDPAHARRERDRARDLKKSVWWQQQCLLGVCHYCHQKVPPVEITMDHIVPVSRGGASTKGNVVPCCKACNSQKAYLTSAEQILNSLEAQDPELFRQADQTHDLERHEPDDASETPSSDKFLFIANPHGFCSGVARAIQMAEAALNQKPETEAIYCLHEIVHNQHVVAGLSARGMVFVKSVEEVPEGSRLLFSAHGVSPMVRQQAAARHLQVIDATCPFVAKVHDEVLRFSKNGMDIICIGHRTHEEVVGVVGEAPERVRVVENEQEVTQLDLSADCPLAVVTQTTLGESQVGTVMAALRARYPQLVCPPHSDICYATRDRQRAVKDLAHHCACVIVLGSANSSNSQRLVETAQAAGAEAVLISDLSQLTEQDWSRYNTLGVTSGASTPEDFLEQAVHLLYQEGFSRV